MGSTYFFRPARRLVLVLSALLFGLGNMPQAQAANVYAKFFVSEFTWGVAINNFEYSAGWYSDINSDVNSFIRAPDGTITQFSVPFDNSSDTTIESLNKDSASVGFYLVGGDWHGFMRSPSGQFSKVDVPGSAQTLPYRINDAGAIAGTYVDSANAYHGFIRKPNGKVYTFDPPDSVQTWALSLSNGGDIVGYYYDASEVAHGFARSKDGAITTFDVVGASATYASDVNSAGTVAGVWTDTNNINHFFFRNIDGSITTFDPPGSLYAYVVRINNKGNIFGTYANSIAYHGFELSNDGVLKVINYPTRHGRHRKSTIVWGCNDKNELVGTLDRKTRELGFTRTH